MLELSQHDLKTFHVKDTSNVHRIHDNTLNRTSLFRHTCLNTNLIYYCGYFIYVSGVHTFDPGILKSKHLLGDIAHKHKTEELFIFHVAKLC